MCLEAGHDTEGAAGGGPSDALEGHHTLQGRNDTKGSDAPQGHDHTEASLRRREAPQAMTPLERNMFKVLEEEERRSKTEGKKELAQYMPNTTK